MARVGDLAQLVRNAREIRGLTQEEFANELGRGQSLVSKYERGLVEPPGDVIMHCVNITRGEDRPISPGEVARLVETKLGAPAYARLRAAIAAVIESVPADAVVARRKARR